MESPLTGVLIMAYGSAPSMEDKAISEYLRHILQHYRRTDPDEAEFEHLKERYQVTGGSPLYGITESITKGIQHALDLSFPERFRTYMAMKHSPPLIQEVVVQMAEEGVERAIAVALAPFRSRFSTQGYYREVEDTNGRLKKPLRWSFVQDWNLHPFFLQLWQRRIEEAIEETETPDAVIFSNHSLPTRIQEWNDPYTKGFEATAKMVAEKSSLTSWTTAYQSKGGGNQEWLGPPLVQVLEKWKDQGNRNFLVAPIGFLMDHLEILYDLDVEAQSQADRLGIKLARTQMPNDDPLFIAVLVDVIKAEWLSQRQ